MVPLCTHEHMEINRLCSWRFQTHKTGHWCSISIWSSNGWPRMCWGMFLWKTSSYGKAEWTFIYDDAAIRRKTGIHSWSMCPSDNSTLKIVEVSESAKHNIELKVGGKIMVCENEKGSRSSINSIHSTIQKTIKN